MLVSVGQSVDCGSLYGFLNVYNPGVYLVFVRGHRRTSGTVFMKQIWRKIYPRDEIQMRFILP